MSKITNRDTTPQDGGPVEHRLARGGVAALAAVFVLITGVIGAIFGPSLLTRLGVRSPEARGMALGMTAHAVGTAVAMQENEECGAFAALAMSLMGVATAVFLPLAVSMVV